MKYNMTIKSPAFYNTQLWDWGFLDQCFEGTKIRATDIDGFVERHGKFLVIECKSHNAAIPTGQDIMFKNMIATGLFTVLIIWGEANKPERCELRLKDKTYNYSKVDKVYIQRLVHGWFASVSNRPQAR
jgi:hypothetical protein